MVSFQNLVGPRLIKRGFNKALFRVEEVQQNNKNKLSLTELKPFELSPVQLKFVAQALASSSPDQLAR